MRRRFVLAAAVAAGLGLAAQPASAADTYRFMTGPQGGAWVPLAGSLKAMWEKAIPDVSVQTQPGAGIANVLGVHQGKAEIGFGNSISTVDGMQGAEPFKEKTANVCQLASLYPQYFKVAVLAGAGINSVADLKGKSVAIQTRGNTAEVATQHILKVFGMDYMAIKPNFIPSYTDAVSMMKDGHAQAFTLGTTIPSSAVMDLASARDMKILNFSDDTVAKMRQINPGYAKVSIPANTYPKQTQPVQVVGYAAHLIASCKLPADRVYAMTKTMHANFRDLILINKAMEATTPKMMAEDIGVPLHPGAARYFKEIGAL
ncbi:MAG: TAXI family TRAP transporter solute-binding subunit [Alphaproteobacteria bacterium]|nr:TAXI family TRAP transporter solute-binding subunit [Alphaproteobacteria bacterium]